MNLSSIIYELFCFLYWMYLSINEKCIQTYEKFKEQLIIMFNELFNILKLLAAILNVFKLVL